MKNKLVILAALVFFSLVNTWYYLADKWAILEFMFMAVFFFSLAAILTFNIYKAFRQRWKDKQNIITISFLILILGLTVLYPTGLINFEQLQGKDVFVARIEGTAHCQEVLKLKEGGHFYIRASCFGVETTEGSYSMNKDTVRFIANKSSARDANYVTNYKCGVIRPDTTGRSDIKEKICLYRSGNDTAFVVLYVNEDKLSNSRQKQFSLSQAL